MNILKAYVLHFYYLWVVYEMQCYMDQLVCQFVFFCAILYTNLQQNSALCTVLLVCNYLHSMTNDSWATNHIFHSNRVIHYLLSHTLTLIVVRRWRQWWWWWWWLQWQWQQTCRRWAPHWTVTQRRSSVDWQWTWTWSLSSLCLWTWRSR